MDAPAAMLTLQINRGKEISIYPNPACEVLYFEGCQNIKMDIAMFDASGGKVIGIENFVGNCTDINTLKTGQYILRAIESGTNLTLISSKVLVLQ